MAVDFKVFDIFERLGESVIGSNRAHNLLRLGAFAGANMDIST